MKPIVLVFRRHLLDVAEPFIGEQMSGFRMYEPVACGISRGRDTSWQGQTLSLEAGPVRRAFYNLTASPATLLRRLADTGVRPAIVHAHFGVDGLYALPIARRLNVPLVVTFHGFDATISRSRLLRRPSPAFWRYALGRRALDNPRITLLGVSRFITQRVRDMGFAQATLLTHHIGIDLARHRAAFDERTPTIVHVARLVEKKGTAVLLRACATAFAERPDARLEIIGDGPLRTQLEAQTRSLGLTGQVIFRGRQPRTETLSAIGAARLLALPSLTSRDGDSEGLGMVCLEAAAQGVPVVASRHGGIPDAIVDGVNGILVPESDADALAAALIRLLDAPTEAALMGRRGRELLSIGFDLVAQCTALESIYDDARRRFLPWP